MRLNVFRRWHETARIASINSFSLAKVLGLMYLIISLVFSPFIFILVASEVALYSILHDPVLFSPFIFILVASEGLIAGEALSIFAFVILFYGIAGAIGGLLIGIIYNFVAKRFGGIELEFETY